MKKTFILIISILVVILAAGLLACRQPVTPAVNLPTLDTIELLRATSDYVDPDNLLCLEVKNEAGDPRTEEVRITINILNKDKLPIVSFKVNDDLYNSSNWNADTINWSKITVRYRPKETSGDFNITVHSIFYRQSNVQKEIKHLSGNTKTVRIAPTFTLNINAEAALKPFSTQADVKFMQSLYDIKALLQETDMNHPDFRRESYTFTGWYTEPNGQGERINESGRYEFYKGIAVYANYECLYNYDVLTDEHNEEYAKILSMTDAGKLKFINLDMEEAVDGYPIKEIGAGAMQSLNVQSSISLSDGVEVIGDNAFMGLTIRIRLGSKVKIIGKSAFSGCTGLVNFFIPSSVKEIGDFAFQGTGWETSVNNERVVENMTNTGSIYRHKLTLFIPKELEKLGKEVFKNSTFEKVYFVQGSVLQEAGEGIFTGSKSLTTLITSAAFENREKIVGAADGSVSFLPAYAFYDNPKLKDVTLSEGLNAIGNKAFASTVGFKDFRSVTLPASLVTIGDYAFQNCHLSAINFADGSKLESIGDYAFENTKVREIDIKSALLTNYGVSPFYNNWNLRVVMINAATAPAFQKNDRDAVQGLNGAKYVKYLVPKASLSEYRQKWVLEGVSWWSGNVWKEELRIYAREDIFTDTVNNLRIGYEDLDGNDVIINYIIEGAGIPEKSNIQVPSEFDVGGVRKTVRKVGKYLTNAGVATVTLPETLYQIADNAFEGCGNLSTIAFGNLPNITAIGKYAFKGTAITEFISWEKLSSIGEGAFKECSSLRTVKLINGTSMEIGVSAFENTALNTLALGNNVNKINSAAFAYNKTLYNIYIDMEVPPAYTGVMLVGPFRGAGSDTAPSDEGMNLFTDIFLPSSGAKRAFEEAYMYSGYKNNYEVLEDRGKWKEQGFPS